MCCFRTGSGLNWLVITGPGSPALNAVLKPRDMPWHSSFVVSKTCDTSHLGAVPRPRTDMKHSDFGRVTGCFNFSLPGFITLIWLLLPWGSPRMPEKPKQALQLFGSGSLRLYFKRKLWSAWRQRVDPRDVETTCRAPERNTFWAGIWMFVACLGIFASRFVRMRFATGRSARVC